MTRAVLDTNVVLASQRSAGFGRPNVEIMRRWDAGEFEWLYTGDILEEYAEKLLEHGIAATDVRDLFARLFLSGVAVKIGFYHLHYYLADPDDTVFLLTALNGEATHLVTYDRHLRDVSVFYPEFTTCKPVEFLVALRKV
jgi:predicted nucleic acid-binding protein